jgi:hypothetical protein
MFLVALLPRLLYLDRIPTLLVHDEVYYAAQAQSLAAWGSDPSGTWSWWSLLPAHSLFAEWSGVVMLPAAVFFSDPLVAARFTSAILGSLLVVILARLAEVLTGEKKIGYLAFGVALLNPWLFQNSRQVFDALFSLTFFFGGVLILLQTKEWQKCWALPLFFFGFFQYQGLKLLMVPIVLATLSLVWARERGTWPSWKSLRSQPWLLVIAAVTIAILGVYIVRIPSSPAAAGRVGEMLPLNQDLLSSKTNLLRRQSLTSPLNSLMLNKATVALEEMSVRYLRSFEPLLLFGRGEALRNPSSVYSHGFFFLLDGVFILIALFYAWQHKPYRATTAWLLVLAALSPLTTTLNSSDPWLMFRSSLIIPVGILLSAIGAHLTLKTLPRGVAVGLAVVYLGLATRFSYDYFLRYPAYATAGPAWGERVMNSYIERVSKDRPVLVLVDENELAFMNWLVMGGHITTANKAALTSAFQTHSFALGSVEFGNRCLSAADLDGDRIVFSSATNVVCDGTDVTSLPDRLAITSLQDGGAALHIYHDTLCGEHVSSGYSRLDRFGLLDIEQLSTAEFCEAFIAHN